MNVEHHVKSRYSKGAQQQVEALCCPVSYDTDLLKLLPQEIIDKDYGCGDPSRYVRPGDRVLDLGSGGGKICYMAAQLTGPEGSVVGVDMNDDMLDLARRHKATMAEKLGSDRVTFHKGRIQDLSMDLEALDQRLHSYPIQSVTDIEAFETWKHTYRTETPMIADDSIDLVVSNCVLNLVDASDREQMLAELYRVVKPGGRVAISDIVADDQIPDSMKNDPELWSGCISGAYEEMAFMAAFRDAGFSGVTIDKWDETPWRVVQGIEFRSVTLTAVKQPVEWQTEAGQAVIYRGPLAAVMDELGNLYPAGERMAVSEEVFNRLGEDPYTDMFIRIQPANPPARLPYTAKGGTPRPAFLTRGSGKKDRSDGGKGGRCC
ncbi:MAG: methyltransferase domain-containing protein [Magnetococcales bacterium]|nr:methyltransferase domain-containing protein [Magnetococcales bacterium]